MKKIYLLLLCASFLYSGAQTSIQLSVKSTSAPVAANTICQFTTSPAPATNSFVSITLDIKNSSTTNTITYTVKKYTLARNIPAAGDSAYPTFCVGGQCYGAPTKTADVPFTLAPLESTGTSTISYYSWDIDCTESDTKRGYTYVKYTIYNINNINDSVQVSAIYNEDLKYTAITENSPAGHITISPNPASGQAIVNLHGQEQKDLSVRIFNLTGQEVHSVQVPKQEDQIRLDLESLAPGIYITELRNASAVFRERLVVE